MGATREKIAFTASGADTAQRGVAALKARYGDCPMDQADVKSPWAETGLCCKLCTPD